MTLIDTTFGGHILLGPDRIPVPTQLTWSDTDPLAIGAFFFDSEQGRWVQWTFAFDLLLEGVATVAPDMAGEGDVRIQCPDLSVLHLWLSPKGRDTCLVELSWDKVWNFVTRISAACSEAQEAVLVAQMVDIFLFTLEQEAF